MTNVEVEGLYSCSSADGKLLHVSCKHTCVYGNKVILRGNPCYDYNTEIKSCASLVM